MGLDLAALKIALVRCVFSAVAACDAGFALMVVFGGFVIRVPEMKKARRAEAIRAMFTGALASENHVELPFVLGGR